MEYMELRQEIDRTARSTQFNGNKILRSGSGATRDFQIGTNTDANSRMSIKENDLTLTEFNLNIVDSSIPNAEEATMNLQYIDDAINKLSGTRAKVGSLQNRLMSTVSNLEVSKVNEMDSMSKRMDADFALETSEKLRAEGKLAAATSVLAQSNLFSAQTLKLLKDS
jgi:flagellin